MQNSIAKAKVISVVSGKGGTGKSTFSAGIALALAKQRRLVLLIDLDFGLRSLDIMLGVEDKVVFDIGDIVDQKCSVEDAIVSADLTKGQSTLSKKCVLDLLFSPVNISKSFHLPSVLSLIKEQIPNYDFIIIDLPAGLGLSVMMSKELADLICVVTIPDAVAIRDTQKVCSIISQSCETPFKLIINRVSKALLKASGVGDLDMLLDIAGAPLLGVLREDGKISQAFLNESIKGSQSGKIAVDTQEAFAAIAKRIIGEYIPLVVKKV